MPPHEASDPSTGAGPGGVADLHRRDAAAKPQRLADLRQALSDWAHTAGLDPACAQAVVLSAHEAAANVVEHAYPAGPGELAVNARYRMDPARIEVTVTDRGCWRAPPADPGDRGRGLGLIRRLTDHLDVRPSEHGTTVVMTWALPEPRPT